MKFRKYGNKKTVASHGVYDSKKESKDAFALIIREKAGEIRDLKKQVTFILMEGFTLNGKKYRPITYVADFVYTDVKTLKSIVHESKGFKTEVYRIKKKLFLKLYGEQYDFIESI
jgi:hypothetical protein